MGVQVTVTLVLLAAAQGRWASRELLLGLSLAIGATKAFCAYGSSVAAACGSGGGRHGDGGHAAGERGRRALMLTTLPSTVRKESWARRRRI
jgi:hypothetical protein